MPRLISHLLILLLLLTGGMAAAQEGPGVTTSSGSRLGDPHEVSPRSFPPDPVASPTSGAQYPEASTEGMYPAAGRGAQSSYADETLWLVIALVGFGALFWLFQWSRPKPQGGAP